MRNLLVSTRKGLFRWQASSTGSWSVAQTAFLGDPVTLALHDARSGYLYAALKLGHFGVKLHRSADDGCSWHEIACPAYPPFPPGREADRCAVRQIEIPWNMEQIWALTIGGAEQPGRLWCGSLPGGLFRSDDHGQTWSLIESLWNHPSRRKWVGGGYDYPGIHSICVDPRDPRRIALGVSCGGIWRSEDDGATWQQAGHGLRADYAPPEQAYDPETQDPHFVAHCPAAPDRVWVQHHNGIFVSSDGGRTFSGITRAGPSVFGFAVAAHPQDPDTAWFAPAIKDELRYPVDAAFAITRTRDGGASFETLREGLPQQHSYDLVYRHALAIDQDGETLAAGSTTGNLWLSRNQGDQWSCLSSTLPPVYSVSFYES